jgi:hypothetical protein
VPLWWIISEDWSSPFQVRSPVKWSGVELSGVVFYASSSKRVGFFLDRFVTSPHTLASTRCMTWVQKQLLWPHLGSLVWSLLRQDPDQNTQNPTETQHKSFTTHSSDQSCSSNEFKGGDDGSLRFQFWHLELSRT